MKSCDVLEMQKNYLEEPCFFVDIFNVGRGFMREQNNKVPYIASTEVLHIWKIIEDKLIPLEPNGLFYNTETYLVQFTFKYVLHNNESKLETVFFYWTGSNATKGLSPLPENFNNDTAIVNRIVQWSEPPVFFHIFSKPIVVLDGKFDCFDPKTHHLFIVMGELTNELHLYELPYLKKNLRSRGVFFIVAPEKQIIYIWRGSKVTKDFNAAVTEFYYGAALKSCIKLWEQFNFLEMKENDEFDLFSGDTGKYFSVEEDCNFSPRLFYLNSITGEFLATEIEYSLRSKNCVAAFPFLQSHLNTGDQPGLFLLDNNHEIWLVWNGLKTESSGELYNVGTETANKYAHLKANNLKRTVPVRFVNVDTELNEFTNIFPYWK